MSSKKLPFVRVHQREKDKDCNNGGLSGCGTMQQLLKNYLSFHFKRTYVHTIRCAQIVMIHEAEEAHNL